MSTSQLKPNACDRCEQILDMGVIARNNIHFNSQGNILLVCALGNLQGTIDVWEIKKHKKQIASFKAPDTTQVAWLNGKQEQELFSLDHGSPL